MNVEGGAAGHREYKYVDARCEPRSTSVYVNKQAAGEASHSNQIWFKVQHHRTEAKA